jgi:PAS domain S-box-containing protein
MQEIQASRSVAAAELVRNFAHWREVGAQEPVLVTHHGRETHIFVGLERFQHLAGPMGRSGGREPRDRVRELAGRIHQGMILCRSDLTIDHANAMALGIAKRWDRHLEDRPLFEALPELAGALTEAHIRHSLASGEASAADIPSPFRADHWLHFETFPFGSGIAILLRDITADVQRHRLADVKSAILKAMGEHGGVGYLRISTRGFIEIVDDSFCRMVGLPPERLTGANLSDLIALPARAALRETLEAVLRGEGDRRIESRLLSNQGAIVEARIGMALLRGTYGAEGAVLVVTPTADPAAS